MTKLDKNLSLTETNNLTHE